MIYEIKRGEIVVAAVKPTGRATSRIMGEEIVNFQFSLAQNIAFQKHDYITFKGKQYSILKSYNCEQSSTKEWIYNITFYSIKYRLNEVSLLFPDSENEYTISSSFLVADAAAMVAHVVNNANRVQSGWSVGTVDATETKNVQFDEMNCLTALSKIADEFKLEFWVDSDKSIHFTERKPDSGVTLKYGKAQGFKSLARQPLQDSEVVTRLYAKGAEKNLPQNYRGGQKNLRMTVPYLQKNVDKYGIIEHTEIFEDVFPRRTGTVTAVDENNPFVFTDSTMDFDLNATDSHGNKTILIPNLLAKVVFQTGQLAGYRFEIPERGYHSATKTFTILPNKQETSWDVPSALVRPAVGDKYILEDIAMPESYVTAAEAELQAKAQEYLDKNSSERFSYSAPTDAMLFKELNYQPQLGSLVHVESLEFDLDADLRITAISEDVQNLFDVQIDFSEVAFLTPVVTEYYEQERKEIQRTKETKFNAAAARAAYYFARENAEKIFDPDGYFDMANFKAASIDSKLISLGARSQVFRLPGVNFRTADDYTTLVWTGGNIVHLTISDDGPRTWSISAGTQEDITAEYQHIYVKAQKTGTNATIYATPEELSIDADPDWFYFEAGYMSSIQSGVRLVNTNYGFAEISPNQITIGTWKAPIGSDYITMHPDHIEIKGKLKIGNGKDVEEAIQDSVDELQIGGKNLLLGTSSEIAIKTWNGWNLSFDFPRVSIIPGEFYTAQIYYENPDQDVTIRIFWYDENNITTESSNGTVILAGNSGKAVITAQAPTNAVGAEIRARKRTRGGTIVAGVGMQKLEKGTKATDWTPAPEDLQAEIEQSKLDAIAASNAYAEAKANLAEIEAKAYADDVVSAEEARAILDATNKADAAKTYAEAQDALLQSQLEAYADGKVSAEEQARINQAAANLTAAKNYAEAQDELAKTAANAYADGIVTAEELRAIADATAKMEEAKEHAQDLVDELEEEVNDNAAEIATAKANAQNAQNTANSVAQITSFLGTTIDDNVVATGTLLVGDVIGANAGITGVTDMGEESVRMWVGADYENRYKAPWRLHDNGFMKGSHQIGEKHDAFRWGVDENGTPVLDFFHHTGFKTFTLDPNRGLIAVNYIPESWTNVRMLDMNQSSPTLNVADARTFLQSEITSTIDYIGEGLDVIMVKTFFLNVLGQLYYDYQNGTHPENAQYESNRGYKSTYGSRTANIPNGWYAFDFGVLGFYRNPPNFNETVNYALYYIQNGKVANTQMITLTLT